MSVSRMLPIGVQMQTSVANHGCIGTCGYGSVSGVLANLAWIVSCLVSYVHGSANRTSGKSGHIRTLPNRQYVRNSQGKCNSQVAKPSVWTHSGHFRLQKMHVAHDNAYDEAYDGPRTRQKLLAYSTN
jgi:hypothetical protein